MKIVVIIQVEVRSSETQAISNTDTMALEAMMMKLAIAMFIAAIKEPFVR